MLRTLFLVLVCAHTVSAQFDRSAVDADQILVLNGRFDGGVDATRWRCTENGAPFRRVLAAAKPRPEGNLAAARILSFQGDKRVHLRAAMGSVKASKLWWVHAGNVVLIPPMPRGSESSLRAAVRAVATFLKTAAKTATPPSRNQEILLRLFLIRHHPEPSLRFAQGKILGKIDCTRAYALVEDLRRRGREKEVSPILPLSIMDCFTGQTRVATPTGPIAIQHLRSGSWILDGAGEPRRVRRVLRHVALQLVSLRVGRTSIQVTPGHLIHTTRGIIPARKLQRGDDVQTRSGPQRVTALGRQALATPIPVFNLDLDEGSSFLVSDLSILVGAHRRTKPEPREAAAPSAPIPQQN